MSKNLVTLNQALALRKLGYKENSTAYAFRFSDNDEYILQRNIFRVKNDEARSYVLAMPTVDEAIDWLRRKFCIIVYDAVEPYVNPTTHRTILYSYKVKYCSLNWGWNQRKILGRTKSSPNSYATKRQALWIALRYIKKRKDAEDRRKSKTRRERV